MINLINLQNSIYQSPWFVLPSAHGVLRQQYENIFTGKIQMPDTFPMEPDDMPENDDSGSMDSGSMESNIAVIEVDGVIGKHLGWIETMLFGMVDVDVISEQLDEAVSDPNIDTIVFYFCTPGGTVNGTPELASKIAEASKVKNTIAYFDVMCCSAGYYLASQCNAIYASPTVHAGSVGVYSIYLDTSVMLANEGVKINAISAGSKKLSGAEWKPMSDEERVMFQSEVDKIYIQFKSAVTSKRAIADEDLQGQCFTSDDLINKNIIDGYANSLNELLAFLVN
jgi:protease-4